MRSVLGPLGLRVSVVLLAVAAVTSGCAGSHHNAASPTATSRPATDSPPATPVPTTAPGGGADTGLITPLPGITDRVVLSLTEVQAGMEIKATLVIHNATADPIDLRGNSGCTPRFAVALANSHYHPRIAWSADCQANPFLIRPGDNSYPSTVTTTYSECSNGQAAGLSLPKCLPSGPPSLPLGEYQTVLYGESLPLPQPAPVIVTVTVG